MKEHMEDDVVLGHLWMSLLVRRELVYVNIRKDDAT